MVVKQYLDLGVQNLLVPTANSVTDAEAAVHATRYRPRASPAHGRAEAARTPGRLCRRRTLPQTCTTAGKSASVKAYNADAAPATGNQGKPKLSPAQANNSEHISLLKDLL